MGGEQATATIQSPYLRQSTSNSFSIRKTEHKAVSIAKRIAGRYNPSDLSAFASYLNDVAGVDFLRTSQMLNNLAPIKHKRDLLRVALAIINYLPCFDGADTFADMPYTGNPSFKVHGRIISVVVVPKGKYGNDIRLQFLAMSSILAGRLYNLTLTENVAERLVKKLYCGRSDLAPYVSLSGCYLCIQSRLLYNPIYRSDLEDIVMNAEERRLNKELYKARTDHNCNRGKSCYECLIGRDQCPYSTHAKTREESTVELQRETAGDSRNP